MKQEVRATDMGKHCTTKLKKSRSAGKGDSARAAKFPRVENCCSSRVASTKSGKLLEGSRRMAAVKRDSTKKTKTTASDVMVSARSPQARQRV
jgi:hypothetical protein